MLQNGNLIFHIGALTIFSTQVRSACAYQSALLLAEDSYQGMHRTAAPARSEK